MIDQSIAIDMLGTAGPTGLTGLETWNVIELVIVSQSALATGVQKSLQKSRKCL